MIILPNQKAAFVHVPKTGGDAVTKFLLRQIPESRHSGGGKHWPRWMHRGIPPNFRTFAFVREPVAWYRSFYSFITQHFIIPHGQYPIFEPGMYHLMRRWEKYDFSSFENMVYSVYRDEPAYYTRMLEWMIGPEGSGMTNFVGKQETLSQDLSEILGHLGCREQAIRAKRTPRINSSKSKFDVSSEIRELIHSQEHAVYRRFRYRKGE